MSEGVRLEQGDRGLRVALYATTIFISSACLMVLEISAGRLLAPYIGVSLYTWTSIIGVILAGLSLGNWLGGVWADRSGNEQSAGLALAVGGIASLGILLILTVIAPLIQGSGMGLLSASFFFVLALFFVPAALLGVVTPLLTTLALRIDSRTGHIVGLMHALAALGSIAGTFVTGYWLIQYFGTRNVVTGTAVVLFVLALPFLWQARRIVAALIMIVTTAVVAAIYTRQGFATPCDRESNYFCIRVVDESGMAPFGQARALILDHLLHGVSHQTEPGMLIPPYMHLMDELILGHFEAKHTSNLAFFFAGGGSYTQPRAVQELYPEAHITVVELDPLVTRVAEDNLYLNTSGMRVFHRDTRVILNALQRERFDVIVGDVFHDISIPYHLVTQEYAQLVKSRLKPRGLYTLNVVDVFPDPRLVKSLFKTLSSVFEQVHVWLEVPLPVQIQRATFVLSAGDATHRPPELLAAQRGLQRTWYRITEPMLNKGTPVEELPILTDDAVPVERLLSSLFFSSLGQ
ncbi:MAG: hypothetical protein GXP09_03645 [Gammaproteobacteria bacterium]|nr:hypothetical protein [Gammaproteobacteria bacterium]